MSKVTLLSDGGEASVWIGLEESEPPNAEECFIIGIGAMEQAAIDMALKDLASARDQLFQLKDNVAIAKFGERRRAERRKTRETDLGFAERRFSGRRWRDRAA